MQNRFVPYEGNAPYVFLSYSRGDTEKMLAVAQRLRSKEYRLWYDEGIPGGNDWPLYISQHMDGCKAVLCFLSGKALVSPNCYSEMMSAARQKKPVLCVTLDESAWLLQTAVQEERDLTPDEKAAILEGTAAYAARRKSTAKIPKPEDWLAALRKSQFIAGRNSHEEIFSSIEKLNFLTDDFKGSYSVRKHRRDNNGLWLAGICVCLCLTAALVLYSLRLYEQMGTGQDETVTEIPSPAVDPNLFENYINSNLSFPDAEQERAIRAALKTPAEEIADNRLAEITELHFCGRTVLASPEGINCEEGIWKVNGAKVAQGEIRDLSLMGKMYYLERLTLVYQDITTLRELSHLQALRQLDVSGNPLTRLDFHDGFAQLETLNISHTQIQSLAGINPPAALKRVYVSADMFPMTLEKTAKYEVILIP